MSGSYMDLEGIFSQETLSLNPSQYRTHILFNPNLLIRV